MEPPGAGPPPAERRPRPTDLALSGSSAGPRRAEAWTGPARDRRHPRPDSAAGRRRLRQRRAPAPGRARGARGADPARARAAAALVDAAARAAAVLHPRGPARAPVHALPVVRAHPDRGDLGAAGRAPGGAAAGVEP